MGCSSWWISLFLHSVSLGRYVASNPINPQWRIQTSFICANITKVSFYVVVWYNLLIKSYQKTVKFCMSAFQTKIYTYLCKNWPIQTKLINFYCSNIFYKLISASIFYYFQNFSLPNSLNFMFILFHNLMFIVVFIVFKDSIS